MDDVNQTHHYLVHLDELKDWKISDGFQDVRGWDFVTYGREKIGTVKNLIANVGIEKITYLEIELVDNINDYRDFRFEEPLDEQYKSYYGTREDNRILVPIGTVYFDTDKNDVVASSNLTMKHFALSPRYDSRESTRLSPVHEVIVLKHYAKRDENYQSFNEELRYHEYSNLNSIDDAVFYENDFFNDNYYTRYNT